MTLPLGGKTMGDRCLTALKALGGQAATEKIRAQVEVDWRRPLTTAQVAVALACLSREPVPRVSRRPALDGGMVWRAVLTPADTEVLAAELPVLEDRVLSALEALP